MIRSMTAFARNQDNSIGSISCEMRSVNQRYLDLTFRLPDTLRDLEPVLRERLRDRLQRGKVECTLRIQNNRTSPSDLKVNQELIGKVHAALQKIIGLVDNLAPVNPFDILSWPGIIQEPETDQDALNELVLSLIESTLSDLIAMREREGERLKAMILQRLDEVSEIVADVRNKVPVFVAHYRERLVARLEEIKQELDPGRLEQELVFLSQKADVEEELDRLDTHVAEIRRTLSHDVPVGRRLDFLMQELNREANTLSSKSIAADISMRAVDLKVLIEQMREQVQNIE